MGKFEKGILGHFDGKVGTVIGSRWKGIEYMKSKNRKSTKPKTIKQLKQQQKFGLVTRFTASLSKLMKDSFNDPNERMTGVNLAVSINLEKAIMGDYPAYAIDYTKVMVSQGTLHNAFNPEAVAGGNSIVKFNWVNNAGSNANNDDIAVLVAYCPETNEGIFAETGIRADQSADLPTLIFTGKLVHTWILFYTAEQTAVSSSFYTGSLTVS